MGDFDARMMSCTGRFVMRILNYRQADSIYIRYERRRVYHCVSIDMMSVVIFYHFVSLELSRQKHPHLTK